MGQSASLNAIWVVDAVLGQPEDLPQLADVERVHPKVIRILGQNPGQLTLQGTNTYLVGDGAERILIDTSDGNSSWWSLVEQVLLEEGAAITQVVLTHGHDEPSSASGTAAGTAAATAKDHVSGLPLVRSAFPKAQIWKWLPCVLGDQDCEQFSPGSLAQAFSAGRRKHSCGCDGQVPEDCQTLFDGQELPVGDSILRVLFTPGHSVDSVSLLLEEASQVEAIFTGDSVLGGRTARFSTLVEYNKSLGRLLRLAMDSRHVILLPGHGDMVDSDSTEYLQSILRMQTTREKAILRTLQVAPGTAGDLCMNLYGSGTAAMMAQDLVEQHLEDLQERGRVKGSDDFFGRTWWETTKVVPPLA